MSIKPVDFQMAIPKAMDVAKAHNDDAQKNFALQQQQAAMTQRKAENSTKQVYSREKANGARISEKQKERQEKDASGGEGRRNEEEKGHIEKKNLNKTIQTSTIDIKI